jgi:MFS family permease
VDEVGPVARPGHSPVTGPALALRRTFASLAVRNYRLYFIGQAISLSGTWMQSTAQAWLVLKLSGSGVDLGVVTACQTLPILVLGPVGGVVADRFGKYRILFWTQALAGLQALVLGVLVLSGGARLWMVYGLAILLGLINLVDNPTRQTFVQDMVGRDRVRNAVTLNSVLVNLARAIGPAVAGVLIATVGIGECFLANSVSFAFVLLALGLMRQDELAPSAPAARGRGQMRAGFAYVAHTPVLRNALLLMAVVGTLAYEFQVSLPLIAKYTFHGDATTYGTFTAFMGVGAVLGGLVAAGRRRRSKSAMAWSSLAFGLVMALASLAPDPLTERLALFLVGAGSVTFLSLGNTTLQLESDPQMRGRVMSLWSVAFLGSTPIGGPVVGWVGDKLGPRYGLGLGAIAALGAGLLGLALVRGRSAVRAEALPARTGLGEGSGVAEAVVPAGQAPGRLGVAEAVVPAAQAADDSGVDDSGVDEAAATRGP